MSNNLIYAYKKKSENKIVYVGQTVEINTRHKQHILYDPYNPKTKEYNYPLSKGIRKYGADEYELIVLEENIPLQDLNDREKYWINFYDTYWHGYNQTIGGTFPTKPIYEEKMIDLVIEMLKNENYSYKDIMEKTNMSLTHIYNINIGARRPKENEIYPIRKSNQKGTRGIKFNEEEIKNIHNDLQNTNYDFGYLGEKYNCSRETISRINKGKTNCYILQGYEYPIRKNPHSNAKKSYWENNK